jgi:hypothetical protein
MQVNTPVHDPVCGQMRAQAGEQCQVVSRSARTQSAAQWTYTQ